MRKLTSLVALVLFSACNSQTVSSDLSSTTSSSSGSSSTTTTTSQPVATSTPTPTPTPTSSPSPSSTPIVYSHQIYAVCGSKILEYNVDPNDGSLSQISQNGESYYIGVSSQVLSIKISLDKSHIYAADIGNKQIVEYGFGSDNQLIETNWHSVYPYSIQKVSFDSYGYIYSLISSGGTTYWVQFQHLQDSNLNIYTSSGTSGLSQIYMGVTNLASGFSSVGVIPYAWNYNNSITQALDFTDIQTVSVNNYIYVVNSANQSIDQYSGVTKVDSISTSSPCTSIDLK